MNESELMPSNSFLAELHVLGAKWFYELIELCLDHNESESEREWGVLCVSVEKSGKIQSDILSRGSFPKAQKALQEMFGDAVLDNYSDVTEIDGKKITEEDWNEDFDCEGAN